MATLPSPKSQPYDTMVPSVSVDVLPSTSTCNGEVAAVNDAVGGWLGSVPVVPITYRCEISSLVSARGYTAGSSMVPSK